MNNRQYTWKKQKSDERDYPFEKMVSLKKFETITLPKVVNNRKWCSEIQDQGELGSCTGNAWAGLLQYNENKYGWGIPYHNLSRLFIYYNERVIENTVTEDSGAELRDGAKALATQGICLEKDWSYNVSKFAIKPPKSCYNWATNHKIHSYYALNNINDMKTCLSNGQCFVFGFTVYDYFESDEMANTGILKMPQRNEQVLGGHAVMAAGYNDQEQRFLIRNSWGKGWGLTGVNDGYFTMPYAYITNTDLASDFWTCVKDV